METRQLIGNPLRAFHLHVVLITFITLSVACDSLRCAADGIPVGYSQKAPSHVPTEARLDHFAHRLRIWVSEDGDDEAIRDSNPVVDNEMDSEKRFAVVGVDWDA